MLCWLYLNDDDTAAEVEVVNAFRFSFISNNATANEVLGGDGGGGGNDGDEATMLLKCCFISKLAY